MVRTLKFQELRDRTRHHAMWWRMFVEFRPTGGAWGDWRFFARLHLDSATLFRDEKRKEHELCKPRR
jgi:hypothetical protein